MVRTARDAAGPVARPWLVEGAGCAVLSFVAASAADRPQAAAVLVGTVFAALLVASRHLTAVTFAPAVSVALWVIGGLRTRGLAARLLAQAVGSAAGVAAAVGVARAGASGTGTLVAGLGAGIGSVGIAAGDVLLSGALAFVLALVLVTGGARAPIQAAAAAALVAATGLLSLPPLLSGIAGGMPAVTPLGVGYAVAVVDAQVAGAVLAGVLVRLVSPGPAAPVAPIALPAPVTIPRQRRREAPVLMAARREPAEAVRAG